MFLRVFQLVKSSIVFADLEISTGGKKNHPHATRQLNLRDLAGSSEPGPRRLSDYAHHDNSHCTEVTSCKLHLELPVLTHSSLCFIHRAIIDPLASSCLTE